MPTYRVDVEPEVLVWARESIGMSLEHAATRIGVSTLTLMLWEEGAYSEAQPTLVQLRRMAEVYRRPLSAFYLPAAPVELPPKLPDFRVLAMGESNAWSPTMHENYRRVVMQREIALELADSIGEAPDKLELSIHHTTPVEEAGTSIRDWIGLDVLSQLEWSSDYYALNSWIAAIENHDILVAHSDGVPLEEMRGFAVSEEIFPVIVLNGYDSVRGRIFTLLHELVHLTMHSSGVCTLQEVKQDAPGLRDTETYCNRVAGAILMPKTCVLLDLEEHGIAQSIEWTEPMLQHWANRYRVSREAVLRRMVSLGFASLDQYVLKLREYNEQYKKKREQDKDRRERRKQAGLAIGGPNPIVIRVRNFGRRYTSDVLSAYGRHDINAAELSEYLETKVEHIPKIIEVLEQRS